MRLRSLYLDGYGRFSNAHVDLRDGFQVILGPNEKGKTTVRCFVADMLYGQKSSSATRRYEDGQDGRRPWDAAAPYAGRLVYSLDDGRLIEVHRNFDRRSESAQVFDRTNGREITAEFERGRNRELDFAARHTGLSKALFLHVATLGHATLETLGDDDALTQLRERILALADSADEEHSAEAALERLEAHIARIGRPAPNSKRPLPLARARLAEVEAELERARRARAEIAALEERLALARNAATDAGQRRAALEKRLDGIRKVERAERLRKAESTGAELDQITAECFKLSAARRFPLEQADAFQRATSALDTAASQRKRSEDELAALRRELDAELERLGPSALEIRDIPGDYDERLSDLDGQIARLRGCLDDLEAAQRSAEQAAQEARAELEALPNFDQVHSEPVAWLNQITTAFSLACQRRQTAEERLAELEETVAQRRQELEEPAEVFSRFTDFPAQTQEFQVAMRVFEERRQELQAELEQVQLVYDEHDEGLPAYRSMALMCLVVSGAFLTVLHYSRIPGVWIPTLFTGVGLLYFLFNWWIAHLGRRRAGAELERLGGDLERLEKDNNERIDAMDQIIVRAGCTTLRELDALYERYLTGARELDHATAELDEQRALAESERTRVADMFRQLRQTFALLDEAVSTEADVAVARDGAIARYQQFRDASRRTDENRRHLENLQIEAGRMRERLASRQEEEKRLSLEVRKLLRDAGFREEENHTSALGALRAYRIRTAQLKPKRARAELLQERVTALTAQADADRAHEEAARAALGRLLEAAGVDSVEAYRTAATQATTYRELRARATALEQQLEALLGGETLEDLRASAQTPEEAPGVSAREAESLRAELERVGAEAAARAAETHELELALAERTAAQRPLFEIEEEHARLTGRVEELQRELDAAARAAAVIEEAARQRHARIAPRLSELAGRYLAEITGGTYRELLLDRDLRITVRIPQTQRLTEHPERRLSKGTVDQIYLALRLALLRALAQGESVPMLLDDPFANYDDDRLANALRLLTSLEEFPQILLFTCRHDVAHAAQRLGVPVLEL